MDNNFALPAVTDETKVDVYFEVDQRFRPRFVEYRRFARASVTGEPGAPPADRLVARESAGQAQQRTVGFARFIDAVIEEGTGDRSELPFPMSSTALASASVELPGGKLRSGRIAGLRSQFAAAGPTAVKEFDTPQGYRIFQLRCRARRAGSLAGKVFDFAGSVANQYSASSEGGEAYPLCGYYAIVQRDGRDYIELYITGEPNAPGFRQMLDFKFVSNRELRDEEAIIGLLFYVEPGVFIARVQNQMGQGVAFESPGYEMGGG
jgi:hypothetical protein